MQAFIDNFSIRHPFSIDADGLLRCQAFNQFEWQRHAFGTRNFNPAVNITLKQIHSGLVFNAADLEDRAAEGDAVVTNIPALAIGVRTADCVPILLLDTKTRAVAAVHAGWRGTAANIVEKSISKMLQEFDSKSADILAAIGPCIQKCCYEVGPDVWQQFLPLFPELRRQKGKLHLDLAEANARQLRNAGVASAHIYDCGLCTFCRRFLFYSFRREPQNPGRMLSVVERLS